MTPTPESWLRRAKKFEPVKLVRTIKAVLAVASLLGFIGLTQTQVTFLGSQLEVVLPALGAVAWPLVEWLSARWLRSKVTPQARAEPIAVALETAERARANGTPYTIPLGARKAAAHVLDKPEPKPRHPTRPYDA